MRKIKVKPKGKIKKLDKKIVQAQRFKKNLVTTKEKINDFTKNEDKNTPEEYASTKIQNNIGYISRKSAIKSNEIGKKSLNNTKENFIKIKQKAEILNSKQKENNAKQFISTFEKSPDKIIKKATKINIKSNTKPNVKIIKNTGLLTKKEIKTPENIAKISKNVVEENIKATQKIARISKQALNKTIKNTKLAIKGTIKVVKTIITTTKTLLSAIIAGGWIALIIILVIAIIGGFVAAIFNSNGDVNYDTSQIPNSQIVLVAKAQIGNEGGEKFWRWYGFEEYVHWCCCYVSWCANECGYIEKGIIPKFAACDNGINWFKEKNQWHDRGEGYYPIIGDIIFFFFFYEKGNQSGISDHVGIVTRTDITNRTIYTIEGNTSNKCAERMYSLDDVQVMGYGSPKY